MTVIFIIQISSRTLVPYDLQLKIPLSEFFERHPDILQNFNMAAYQSISETLILQLKPDVDLTNVSSDVPTTAAKTFIHLSNLVRAQPGFTSQLWVRSYLRFFSPLQMELSNFKGKKIV